MANLEAVDGPVIIELGADTAQADHRVVRPGPRRRLGAAVRSSTPLYRDTMDLLEIPVPYQEPDATEFTSENGAELLGRVFDNVRAEQYDGGFVAPHGVAVLTYFASTQLYRRPMQDEAIPIETRARIGPAYAALAQQAVDAAGGQLRISKAMTAFFCRT